MTCLALAAAGSLSAAPCAWGQQAEGPRTIPNPGEDRPLAWSYRERFRIGPALDGPGSLFRVYPWTVATDRRGRVYILDVGDYRVAVFDADGRHLRDLGRRGGGPGELVRPVGLAVGDDGVILVADEGKLGLVRFDSAGGVLGQRRLSARVGPIGTHARGIVIGQGFGPGEIYRLLVVADEDTSVLAETPEPDMVRFPSCPMAVPGRPFFAPTVRWAATGELLVVNAGPAYELSVYSGGEEAAIVSRDVPPIEISEAAALSSPGVRRGFEIMWEGRSCKISPEELLEARGYARTMSPIVGTAIAPNGELWVNRKRQLDGPSRIDVFGAGGRYLGTLPEGFPFPGAFQSARRFVVLRHDPNGVPFVVGYEFERGSGGNGHGHTDDVHSRSVPERAAHACVSHGAGR
jgi:hypothetical protein